MRVLAVRFRSLPFLLSCLFLAASLYFLFFHGLADRDLWSSHEARAAQNAQGILDNGDWLLPRLFDQRPELQKPPLYYWLVAAVARLTDGRVDAWAVRLPAALAALACVALTGLLAGGPGRFVAGLVAATVLATALHFTWLARVGRIDMPLTLAVTAVLGGYYQGLRCRCDRAGRGSWRWFLLAYLAMAAGVLLKGPIGLVLPGAVAGVHLLVTGELGRNRPAGVSRGRHITRLVHELGLWWGLPLVGALTVPWFWVANARTDGQFFQVFFWYHNVERGFGGSGKLAEHPWWFYGPCLARDLLPWTPALLLGMWFYGKRACGRDPKASFGLVWLATVLVVLSCMRFKRSDYLLPAFPGAALFLGSMAQGWLRGGDFRAATVRERWRCAAPLRSRLGYARVWLLTGGCALVLAGCVAGWFFYVHRYLPLEARRHTDQQFAAAIRTRVPARQPVIFFCTKAHLLTFHLGKPVATLLEWENLDWWAARPDAYLVMPPELLRESENRLKSGRLVEVLRSTGLGENRHERTLLLVRTQPHADPRPRER
jgi:4-amino-4-deoxy-L-arabinose transferase-like glycosyltransferase